MNRIRFEEIIRKFADYEYNIRGKSKGWKRELAVYLRKYNEYLKLKNHDYARIKVTDAMDFKKHLAESNYSAAYINAILVTTKHCYRYLIKCGYMAVNPFLYVKVLKCEEKVMNDLPGEKKLCEMLEKLSMFYNQPDLYTKVTGFKMHVLAELMYSTGMRISEASLLKEEDIDFDRGIIRITDLKTKKERYGFLNDYCLKLLKIFIKKRDMILFRNNSRNREYIFGTSTNQLTTKFNNVLSGFFKNGFTSHKLRHCFGYHFLKRGCDIFYIKQFLGHTSIDNTQIYTRIDKEDLKKILESSHPRNIRRKTGNDFNSK